MDTVMQRMPESLKKYFSVENNIARTSLANIGMILHCAPVLMNIGWIENGKVAFKYYYDGISQTVAKYIEKMDDESWYYVRNISVYDKDGNEIYTLER